MTVKIRTAGAVLLCAALAACSSSTGAGAATPPSASPPAPVPASSTTTSPGIPASALLQPADAPGAQPQPLEQGQLSYLRPLRPCGNTPYPSDDTRTAAVAVQYVLDPAEPGFSPIVVAHFVGRHTPGAAADQFDQVSDALERCRGGLGEGERRWTVLDTGLAGDESALVRIEQTMTYGDEKPDVVSYYAGLARVNDVIVVITDLGWENLGGSEKVVRDLLDKAVQRAATIR